MGSIVDRYVSILYKFVNRLERAQEYIRKFDLIGLEFPEMFGSRICLFPYA